MLQSLIPRSRAQPVVRVQNTLRFFIFFTDEFKQQLVSQEDKYKSEIQKLQTELNDCQSQLTVARLQYQSTLQEAETEARQHQEELSSLHHLLNGTQYILVTYAE